MTSNIRFYRKCFIPGCKTIFGQDKNIRCHRVRKSVQSSAKERQKWMDLLPFLKEEHFSSPKFLMCSLHFKEDDYIHRPLRHFKREKDLKASAIPSLNLPPEYGIENDSTFQKTKTKSQKSNKLPQIRLHKYKEKKCAGDQKIKKSKNVSCQTVKTSQDVKTKSVGVQCKLICDENLFINKRLKSEQIEEHFLIDLEDSEDSEGFDNEFMEWKMFTDEPTCEIPSDDIFFNEICKTKNENISEIALHCCDQCGLTFTDLKSCRDHEGVHSEISLLCYFCGEISEDYMKHVEHEYRCKKIKHMENNVFKISKKINKCIAKDKFDFENIQNQYSNNKYLESEKLTEMITFYCGICKQIFDNEEICKEHMVKHSIKDLNNTTSIDLNEIPLEKNNLEYKISENTTIEFLKKSTEVYACQMCEKTYATSYLLNRHIDAKHLNPIKKFLFECNECEMSFRSSSKLQSHVREHILNKKHCKICNLIHDNNEMYLKHLKFPKHILLEKKWKSRYDVNSFQCPLCKTEEKIFIKLSDLADHSQFHRISKSRIFINGLLTDYELKLKS